MRKMPTLFVREYAANHTALAKDEVTTGCEWVLAGEGISTQKLDGTCCMVRDGILYKRYDAKKGKVPPAGFEPAQPDPDPITGHWPGWVRVGDEPESWMHREAFALCRQWEDGTYELLGPRVNGNKEHMPQHALVKHGLDVLARVPRDFKGLQNYFTEVEPDIEGIVFHHPDGRMVKIKASDFGLERRPGPNR